MRAILTPRNLALFILLLAAAYAAWAAQFMWRHRDYFPIYDAITAEIFLRYLWNGWNPLGFFDWYANEHRPAFPMAILALDHALAGAIGPLSTVAMYASALTLAVLLAAPKHGERLDARHLLLAAVALVMLFWPGHWENYVWSSQIQIFLAVLAGVGALFIVVRVPDERPPGLARSAAIALLLFVSCFSFASGFVFTGAVLVISWLRFGPSRLVGAIAIALAGAVAVYAVVFWGRDQFGYTAGNLFEPRRLVMFVLRFVAAPLAVALERGLTLVDVNLAPTVRLRLAALLGFLGALYAAGLLVSVLRARRAHAQPGISSAHWMALGLSLFVFGNAFITAMGRSSSPPSYPVDLQRYYVGTVCFWLAVFAHMLRKSAGSPRAAAASAVMAVALLFGVSGATYLDAIRAHADAARKAGLTAMSRLPEVWPMFWLPDLLPDLYARFEAERTLIYAQPWARSFGRTLDGAAPRRDPPACAGTVTRAARIGDVEGSYEVTGRVNAPRSAEWLVVSDAAGTVRGFGAVQRVSGGEAGVPWIAYAKAASLPLSIDVVDEEGALCRLGTVQTADAPPISSQRQPYRTDFDAAAAAGPPDENLDCPADTQRVRWVDGRLLCMPMR
ncbi:MAG: hypothetical protein AB7E79_01090 [Rhodospirillaceae bacterium]